VRVFQESLKSAQEFEKQLQKFLNEITKLTHLTINGLSIESRFSIAIRIEMEPSALSFLSNGPEFKEEEIPFILRQERDGAHIQDIMQLQDQEIKALWPEAEKKLPFLNRPFSLAGCILETKAGILGQSASGSKILKVSQ